MGLRAPTAGSSIRTGSLPGGESQSILRSSASPSSRRTATAWRSRGACASVLAVGWGDTVTRTLKRLGHLLGHTGASVVTLTGGVSTYLQMMGGLSAPIAQAQRLHMIPSPLITSRAATARALLEEPAVQEVIAMARRADCALIGIGALEEDASLVRGGYLSNAELAAYRVKGAVGDILGRFLDHRGRPLDLEIHDRIVGIDLQSLSATAPVRARSCPTPSATTVALAPRSR